MECSWESGITCLIQHASYWVNTNLQYRWDKVQEGGTLTTSRMGLWWEHLLLHLHKTETYSETPLSFFFFMKWVLLNNTTATWAFRMYSCSNIYGKEILVWDSEKNAKAKPEGKWIAKALSECSSLGDPVPATEAIHWGISCDNKPPLHPASSVDRKTNSLGHIVNGKLFSWH